MFPLLVLVPLLIGAPMGACASMGAGVSIDTTVASDTAPVLLSDSAVHTMMRLDTALNAVVKDHPDLQPVYKGLVDVNPYAIAKAPLLAAVIAKAGWTPMQFSRVHQSFMRAMEGIMPVAFSGTRPGMTTIADRNVNYLIDHQVEYGIQMEGGNLPPPSTPAATPLPTPEPSADAPPAVRSEQQSTNEAETKAAKDSASFQEVTLTPDQGTLSELLTGVAKRAQREHLTPIVDVGAPWCAPCHQLDALMHEPSMRETMRGLLVVHLNLDYWHGELDSLKINAASVPIMFAVNKRGAPIDLRMQGVERDAVIRFVDAARTKFSASKKTRH